jgi:transcriptional regulator NrdR family protein
MKVINTEHRADGTHRWYRCPDCSSRIRTLEKIVTTPPTRAPLRGKSNPAAVLTDEKVRRLRQQQRNGADLAMLAAEYGISLSHVARIVNGKYWGHVE